jgi:hypothetical protein
MGHLQAMTTVEPVNEKLFKHMTISGQAMGNLSRFILN